MTVRGCAMDLKTLAALEPWEWPEEAGGVIVRVLADLGATEAERYGAAELAGSLPSMDDSVAEHLLAVVKDARGSEGLRGRAAIALGPVLESADEPVGFEDIAPSPIRPDTFDRIRRSLQAVVEDAREPVEVRRRALEASIRAPEDWHHRIIPEAYGSDDPGWRLTAVFCMQYVQGYTAQILESLGSADPEIHYEAVCAAGAWSLKEAWSHVLELARSGQTERGLRIAAIEAVAAIRPEEALGALGELLDDQDPAIVDAVSEALDEADRLDDVDPEDGGEMEDEADPEP